MRLVGIVGYKNSGKTNLILSLARELKSRRIKVAIVKHAHQELNYQEKDTTKYLEYSSLVGAISKKEALLIFKEVSCLEEILKYISADIVLVEGFKKERSYPKIICARNKEELSLLSDGLEICIYGDVFSPNVPTLNKIKEIADLVIEKAFKLPNLNCKKCNLPSCYHFALEVLTKGRNIKECISMNPKINIKVGGKEIALSPFVDRMIINTIKGMLYSLKGVGRGEILINIRDEDEV
jgi:molybdopterin-guanine dinucleotide biosynthesis protein B